METLQGFLEWAWARHHNLLSWYIRPLFVLPFCYFAYHKSLWGIGLTILAAASSMSWFPAPETIDARTAAFLAMEHHYLSSNWTFGKIALTTLAPTWAIVLALAFWRRSWLAGFAVLNAGVVLKVIWSFYFGGDNAWSIVPPAIVGLVVCNAILLIAYRHISDARQSISHWSQP
jgi:hypothetical protein